MKSKIGIIPVLLSLCMFFHIEKSYASKSITAEKVKYSRDDQEFHGYLAKPKKIKDNTPAILIVHEWWGHNEYAQKRARMLAEEGYIAMALDMYGGGAKAKHPKDAGKMATEVSGNIDLMKKRFDAGMKILSSQPKVDKRNIAALGYCFGGGVALQMARERMPLKAVISYHGTLATQKKVEGQGDLPEILVFHGAADTLVSDEDLKMFKNEMAAAGANFKIVEFPGVKHAFTNPEASKLGKKFSIPLAYDKNADQESWEQSLAFLAQSFSNEAVKVDDTQLKEDTFKNEDLKSKK